MSDRVPPDLRISVVIPHLNQPADLAKCLASVAANTRQPAEIIVVDNGSEVLPVVPSHVTLLCEKTPGPGPSRNLGARHATGDVLAFLDADCRATPEWLEAMQDAMSDSAILGGAMQVAFGNQKHLTRAEAYESIYAFQIARYIAEENFAATANLAVRREVLDAVGPFAGLSVAEDRDWCHRAVAMGYEITFAPQMVVLHPARADVAALCRKWDRQLAHDYGAVASGTDRLRWLVKALALGVSPVWEVIRIARTDKISGLHARMQAFAALVQVRVYRMLRMLDLLVRGRPERLAVTWNR